MKKILLGNNPERVRYMRSGNLKFGMVPYMARMFRTPDLARINHLRLQPKTPSRLRFKDYKNYESYKTLRTFQLDTKSY
jgi:hypothetical protein